MHLSELLHEPVNFAVCSVFILLIGLVFSSLVLDNVGLPNPLAYVGGQVGLFLLDRMIAAK